MVCLKKIQTVFLGPIFLGIGDGDSPGAICKPRTYMCEDGVVEDGVSEKNPDRFSRSYIFRYW